MTNKERAEAGIAFIRGDLDLKAQRDRAEVLCYEYNHTHPADTKKQQEILNQLLPNKKSCLIKPPVVIEHGRYITLGENFFANFNCKLIDGGKITFGDNALVGPDCTFVTAVHPLDPEKRVSGFQMFKNITVGHNVWFGAGVLVCPGVTIGDNCVIGAGSVVTKDIPANSFAAGNPCKVIRDVREGDKNLWEIEP